MFLLLLFLAIQQHLCRFFFFILLLDSTEMLKALYLITKINLSDSGLKTSNKWWVLCFFIYAVFVHIYCVEKNQVAQRMTISEICNGSLIVFLFWKKKLLNIFFYHQQQNLRMFSDIFYKRVWCFSLYLLLLYLSFFLYIYIYIYIWVYVCVCM